MYRETINLNSLLCSIDDADVYGRDFQLLTDGNWLNDSCINVATRIYQRDRQCSRILLLDPAVASFLRLQCSDDDEFTEFTDANRLCDVDVIFVPINDNESFKRGSSHWSLLVFYLPASQCWHFDSYGTHNELSARHFAEIIHKCSKLAGLCTVGSSLEFLHVNAAQQRNGYDCGIFVLLNLYKCCDVLLANYAESNECPLEVIDNYILRESQIGWPDITEEECTRMRRHLQEQVLFWASKHRK